MAIQIRRPEVTANNRTANRTRRLGALILYTAIFLAGLSAPAWGQRPKFRKPPPPGVIELTGLGMSSLVELKDGTLLANNGRVSKDGGMTWSGPKPLGKDISGDGFVRLKSGALALTGSGTIRLSHDEGGTWGPAVEVFPKLVAKDGTVLFSAGFLPDAVIHISSGCLLYSGDWSGAGRHPEVEYRAASAWGTWKGQRYQVEGHGHFPETGGTLVAYSYDEGQTWTFAEGYSWGGPKRPNLLMGWFDEMGRISDRSRAACIGECTLAESKDHRVLMFCYPYASRILHSYSSDGGKTWSAVLPTELASSVSPPRLRRVPKTGDLLCVWNHVSRDEIRRGFRRGRLTAAISKDNGRMWENFKTLELSAGLEDVDRIPPETPVDLVLARADVGELPEGFAYFSYANVCFAGDKVYIMYSRGTPLLGIAEQNLHKQEHVLRVYPLAWFYE